MSTYIVLPLRQIWVPTPDLQQNIIIIFDWSGPFLFNGYTITDTAVKPPPHIAYVISELV
jgi:hypothetical protein